MVAGPEVARAVGEFESCYDIPTRRDSHLHHEQNMSIQKNFAADVAALVDTIREMGNPFKEDSGDLLVLDTKEVIGTSSVESIRTMEKVSDK